MSFLALYAIQTKIYDLLRQDSRTLGIDWYNGERAPDQHHQMPAGDVFATTWGMAPYMVPDGDRVEVQFVVELLTGSHEGAGTVDEAILEAHDNVAAVLVDAKQATQGRDPWSIGIATCYIDRMSGQVARNPETSPVIGTVQFAVTVVVLPTT